MKNYYKILQVNENASSEVIEKAYKVLAKKYHPDLHSGTGKASLAESAFKEITEAYEILSDNVLREQYDNQMGFNTASNNVNNINNQIPNNSKYETVQGKKFYVRDLIQTVCTAINNQANKPKDERHRDLVALIITFFIIAILVVVVLNVPILKNLFF